MGISINYPKFGRRAERKAREERVAEAEKRNKESEKSWANSPEIQQVRSFRENEKLQGLFDWATGKDEKQKVLFSKNLDQAEDFVSMLSGESGQNRNEISNSEDKEDKNHFYFKGKILEAGDKAIDPENFELSDFDGITDNDTMSDEEWDRYELTESDKFLIKSLVKNYAGIVI